MRVHRWDEVTEYIQASQKTPSLCSKGRPNVSTRESIHALPQEPFLMPSNPPPDFCPARFRHP